MKAGVLACLFLCASIFVNGQDWKFSERVQQAYDHVLNLQISLAHDLLKDAKTVEANYVLSLAEAIELLATEDAEHFTLYEQRFSERLEKKLKGTNEEFQFLQAEMRLQWAFVYLKFGHELDAALNLREAYQIADDCRKKNPQFIPIKKTTGLLEIIIGSTPEKYNWVLGLLGMEGAISAGLRDLEVARKSNSSIAAEADILHSLLEGFVFQHADSAMQDAKTLLIKNPGNKLLSFITASLAIKNSQSEYALSLLDSLTTSHDGLHLHYSDYLRGEAYLHKGEYAKAIASYRWFANHYKGQNYIKDAYYKIGVCYWLTGNENEALSAMQLARTIGKDVTEADKHATRRLADSTMPNVKLSKVRYFTDGGYYEQARHHLNSITTADLPTKHEQAEYYYRKARLEHKQNQVRAAQLFYEQAIDLSDAENWYFAPNACLQLGYIAVSEDKPDEARGYFNKALSYKKHEYKNSIDSKAKTALSQIRTR
jgi:tetratricopeptide (TPR) repeat protein